MKKILTLLYIPLIIFSSSLYAGILEFPFDQNNKSFFYLNKSVLDNKGISIAPENIKLSNNAKDYTLVNFEELNPTFENIVLVPDSRFNGKSGLFFSQSSSVKVNFDQSLEKGIMIEFWAKPLSTIKSNIFTIQFLSESGLNKQILISLEKGRIHTLFQNMFIGQSNLNKTTSLSIQSNAKILPDEWAHHKITYVPSSGKMTYYYNGEIDTEIWATKSGLPKSSILFLDLAPEPYMLIGKDYRGLIDQFIISNDTEFNYYSTKNIAYSQAYIHTRTIPLPEKSTINLIDIEGIFPTDTDYIIDYRISNTPFNDNTPTEIIPWQAYNKENPSKNPVIQGKYLQARIRLLSDPSFNASPLLKNMRVHYTDLEVPLKPIDVRAYSSNSDLIISLHQNINKNIAGYKVYLGTKPDSFFGDPENGLESPIMVPISSFETNNNTKRMSYHMKGLEANKLYYIKLTAVAVNETESNYSNTAKSRIRILE